MLTRKFASLICTVATASIITAGTAQAVNGHGHDHRALPVDWSFDSRVEQKIESHLNRGIRAVGLSAFEQTTLTQYGINVGNSFKTTVGGRTLEITRTASGLRVEGPATAYADGPRWSLPVRIASPVAGVSIAASHPGHDHRHLGVEWAFPRDIEEKIANNLLNNGASGAIGLKSGEQKMLERYGIRVGNTFNAVINQRTFTVKRTSMGLQILNHVRHMPVAEIRDGEIAQY